MKEDIARQGRRSRTSSPSPSPSPLSAKDEAHVNKPSSPVVGNNMAVRSRSPSLPTNMAVKSKKKPAIGANMAVKSLPSSPAVATNKEKRRQQLIDTTSAGTPVVGNNMAIRSKSILDVPSKSSGSKESGSPKLSAHNKSPNKDEGGDGDDLSKSSSCDDLASLVSSLAAEMIDPSEDKEGSDTPNAITSTDNSNSISINSVSTSMPTSLNVSTTNSTSTLPTVVSSASNAVSISTALSSSQSLQSCSIPQLQEQSTVSILSSASINSVVAETSSVSSDIVPASNVSLSKALKDGPSETAVEILDNETASNDDNSTSVFREEESATDPSAKVLHNEISSDPFSNVTTDAAASNASTKVIHDDRSADNPEMNLDTDSTADAKKDILLHNAPLVDESLLHGDGITVDSVTNMTITDKPSTIESASTLSEEPSASDSALVDPYASISPMVEEPASLTDPYASISSIDPYASVSPMVEETVDSSSKTVDSSSKTVDSSSKTVMDADSDEWVEAPAANTASMSPGRDHAKQISLCSPGHSDTLLSPPRFRSVHGTKSDDSCDGRSSHGDDRDQR